MSGVGEHKAVAGSHGSFYIKRVRKVPSVHQFIILHHLFLFSTLSGPLSTSRSQGEKIEDMSNTHGAVFDPNELTAMAGTQPIHDNDEDNPPMPTHEPIRDEPKPPPPPIKFVEAQDPLQEQAMQAPLGPKAVWQRGVGDVMKAAAWKKNKSGGDTAPAANANVLGTMTDVAMKALEKARADRRTKHNRKMKRQPGQPRNVICRE